MVQGVYVDILLVTNFFVNILLLSLVEAVCGRTKQRWRKVASAFAASLFSLSIFFPPPALGIGAEVTELLFKVLCSLIMVAIAFSWCSLVEFLKEWLVLLTVTMLFYALMGAMQGLFAGAGLFVFDHAIYFHLRTPVFILCLAGAYTLVWSLNRVLRSVCRTDELYRVTLEVDMPMCQEWIGFVDSGNSLSEPFSGSPVVVCSLDVAAKILSPKLLLAVLGEENEESCHVRQIPFSTVSGSGMMPAVRGKRMILRPMQNENPDEKPPETEKVLKEELLVEDFFLAINCNSTEIKSKASMGTSQWQILLSGKLLDRAIPLSKTSVTGKDGILR